MLCIFSALPGGLRLLLASYKKKHWLLVEPTGSQREQYLHRESNSDLRFRKPSFYPLNYGDFSIVVQR